MSNRLPSRRLFATRAHARDCRRWPAVARGENIKAETSDSWPLNVPRASPVRAFHILISVPGLPVAIQLPSGETASVPIRPVGVSTACCVPAARSQMRTELSPAPVARRFLSGRKTAPETRIRALLGTA